MLTCYDASFAALLDAAGVDTVLIGDSLGMVLQGRDSTLAVTLADMVYHTRCVTRGSRRVFVIADLPFGSYQESPQQAFRSAARSPRSASAPVRAAPARYWYCTTCSMYFRAKKRASCATS